MARAAHVGVDLGAGSGRVLVGGFTSGVSLVEAHRFSYAPRQHAGHLRWDVSRLFDGLRTGLRDAAALANAHGMTVRSIGVDSWGVDYALVDEAGALVEDPICYRDSRTDGMMDRVFARVPRKALFRDTGIQFLPFNTIFQLMAHVEHGLPARAARLLMIPDLCHQALCGSTTGEHTNASTSQLLNLETADWHDQLFAALDLPRGLMPPLRPSGSDLGPLHDHLRRDLGLPEASVVQPATHDTASAVAGTPLAPGWAYISSGTWSLVGLERTTPLVDAAALAANVTNERGVGRTFRLLKNVAGLWILECCRREWRAKGIGVDHALPDASAARQPGAVVFPDAPRFFNPRSVLAELGHALADSGQRVPGDPLAVTKIVLDSLACRYAAVIGTLERLTGETITGLHIVGGGSRNEYLNQATANATGRPVLAGPVEATGLGNILMQAVACGLTTVAEGRQHIGEAFPPRHFEPDPDGAWQTTVRDYTALEDTWTATTEQPKGSLAGSS